MAHVYSISPYKHEGLWVFDDEPRGLHHEPFVSGANTMMDYLVQQIPNPERGFRLHFSSDPFPEHIMRIDWEKAEFDGNWYCWEERGLRGWFSAALFKYFPTAPPSVYVTIEVEPPL